MRKLSYDKKDLGPSYAIAVATMLVASILLGFIFGETTGWKFWLMQSMFTLLIGGSAFLYAVISKTNFFAATKMKCAPGYAHVLWGCLAVTFLIACMTPINNALLDGIEALGLPRPSVELESDLAGLLIVAALLPAICEELVFRGTVAQSLSQSKNKWAALAISGALFAIFHANPAQTVHQFVLGALLTLLVLRSGSLWTSVIVHFYNNALVIALSYTPVGADEFWSFTNNTGVVVAILCVGIVGFALSVFGYVKTTKSVWIGASDIGAKEVDAQPDEQQHPKQANLGSVIALIGAVVACVTLWITSLFVV